MATGTSGDGSELDELKETVRQLTTRIELLSAQNSDLNGRLLKTKELFEAQNSDLNARLIKSQEHIQDLERKVQASRKESDKIPLPAWPAPQGFSRWRESVLAATVAASGDQQVAKKFVLDVDDPSVTDAALVTDRPEEMTSIDSKL